MISLTGVRHDLSLFAGTHLLSIFIMIGDASSGTFLHALFCSFVNLYMGEGEISLYIIL